MKTTTILASLLLTLNVFAQTVPVSVANWKNGAKGAYSIIHDDYGNTGVDGIWQYADTIAYNRGVKFTFGAISSDCEVQRTIKGESSPYAYAKNVMIPIHGHEIINHSHTHTCAVNRGWSPCNVTGWGENKFSTDFNTQLYTSHNSIKNNTGFTPKYYIFPYDQFTDLANAELESMGYIGSRTGWHVDNIHAPFYKFGYEANDENLFKPNTTGFFRTSVQVFDDVDENKSESGQVAELNSVVDNAINNNEWGNRELHNVGSSGWGHVKVNAYRTHLNYVQTKVNSGDLWVGTVSELLTYQIQKLVFVPSANFNIATQKIDVSFSESNTYTTANVSSYLAGLTVKTSLTIVLDVSAYVNVIDFNNVTVKQGANTITDFSFKNNKLYVNLYPHEGSFTIESSNPTNVADLLDAKDYYMYPNPSTGNVFIVGDVSQVNVFDTKGNLVLNSTGNNLDISNLSNGVYFVRVNNSVKVQRLIKK